MKYFTTNRNLFSHVPLLRAQVIMKFDTVCLEGDFRGKPEVTIEDEVYLLEGNELSIWSSTQDQPIPWETLRKSIDELELSAQTLNALKADNISFLGDLVSKSETELLRNPSLGTKGLATIKEKLAARGLSLKKG